MSFHHRCGRRITLANNNRTAMRNISDFNHGLVLSAEPLIDDVLFEVRIDEKNHSWSGSIEIGITTENPEIIELPSCATKMRAGTWVMSGISVLKDGISLIEFYGTDLDSLTEGDQVGVARTSQNELVFYINGESQGIAAVNIPKIVYALVNLYGRCVQISICPSDSLEYNSVQAIQNMDITASGDASIDTSLLTIPINSINERIRFHNRCGSLVKLSTNIRTAERRRPLDEFNNGVVMTHRPLKDNELFEIRIDKLVDKWSGSIEVGVTTHNPSALHFPATMTNMRSGTIMMSGCGILTNGKGTRRQYGEFNLDELREGDRVGMMRKHNGNLHYYINGQDQGVAATRVAQTLWGVIDLYGMTIKVTIVDRDEREQQNLVTRRNNLISIRSPSSSMNVANNPEVSVLSPDTDLGGFRNDDRLTFHPICGSHATVTHSGRTALRPNASDDFNNGVVLTKRYLKPNEFFQVRLERVVTKWAGSIEMGVTIHSAQELEFPFTMTNVRSGTWMMTGNGVMHNGTTVIEQYGQNLDRLQVGDRVGVVRKDDGSLHFWVNGVDQGVAATGVPEKIYGVIDLYGQAAQASIVDSSECGSPDTGNSTISNTTLYSEPPLRFHSIHGKNAKISNGGLTASRPKALAEFNDAIVFSTRALRQRELFEVVLEQMVSHWSGNIEMGVTGVRPDDIQLTANATDLEYSTIILCGSVVFQNRKTIKNNIPFDLDVLTAGTRVGVMRNGDSIHFFIDGVDQGPVCECRMQNVWAVVDLYGQCAQVSLTQNQQDLRAPYATSENSQSFQATSVIQPILETKHRWGFLFGDVTLSQNFTLASRSAGSKAALSRCLLFSERPLTVGSPFEIRITSHNPLFAGCLSIGATNYNLADELSKKYLPNSIRRIPADVWFVASNEVRHNNQFLYRSLTSLEWLRVGNRISVELTSARTLKILYDSEEMNICFQNITGAIHAVCELKGSTMAVQVISSEGPPSPLRPCSLRLQDSLEFGIDPLTKQDSMLESMDSDCLNFEFSEYCGKNIKLLEDHKSAQRIKSYNNGLVFVTKPLYRGHNISIKVDVVNGIKYKGTIGVGVVGALPQANNVSVPSAIINCRRPCWVAVDDYININGKSIPSDKGQILEDIQPGTIITLLLSHTGTLSLTVGQAHLEELATGLPNHVYPVFDLYGKCEKISIINGELKNETPVIEEAPLEMENDQITKLETNVPQEKANIEIHEKETENDVHKNEINLNGNSDDANEPCAVTISSAMNRSVMESMSENLMLNISIKNRSLELKNEPSSSNSSSCCLRESLQLQHNTNLNIQRSQSTQRFVNNNNDTNRGEIEPPCQDVVLSDTVVDPILSDDHEINDSVEPLELRDYSDENILELSTSNSRIPHNDIFLNGQTPTALDEVSGKFSDIQIDSLNTHRSGSEFESIISVEAKDCEYLKLICNFKRSLVLPDVFFTTKPPLCFCQNCYSSGTRRLHENSYCLSDWVYFKLNYQNIHNNCESSAQSIESGDWMKLYYVTRVDKIRAVLDRAQPLPDEVNTQMIDQKNETSELENYLILHWHPPNMKAEASNMPYRHISGSTIYSIETIFEVLVNKQSLCFATDQKLRLKLYNEESSTEEQHNSSEEGACGNSFVTSNVNSTLIAKDIGACMLNALLIKLNAIEGGSLEGHHSQL